MALIDFMSPALPPPPTPHDGRWEARRHLGWDRLTPEIQQVVDSVDIVEQKRERDEQYLKWQTQCVMTLQQSLVTTQRILVVVLGFWVVSNGPVAIATLAKWLGIEHPPG